MDKEEAKKILAAHLARYRRLTYAELVRRLKTVVTCDLPPRVLPQIKLVRQQVPAPATRVA